MKYAIARHDHSVACVKIWGAAPPRGQNIPKKSIWVCMIPPLNIRSFWTKVQETFFIQCGRNRGQLIT